MTQEKVHINVSSRLDENVLDLSMSELDHIPVKEIAELRRATTIDLSSNNIKVIPKNFGVSLTRITSLDLSRNQLKFLTDDFCNLVNLKHLDLYNNQLESLPVAFGKLTKLRYLDLKGNPLQPALQKVVGPCLTMKECLNAATNIVPFMCDLELKLKIEQEKKQAEERKRIEKEELEARELNRLAKKAARKERVLRERQERSEAEKFLVDPSIEISEDSLDAQANCSKVTSTSHFKTTTLKVFALIIFIAAFIHFTGVVVWEVIPDFIGNIFQ